MPGKEDYLYVGAIEFIKSLKKGAAFGECCPMLNDISQLPSWKKVNTGMLRLYEGTYDVSHLEIHLVLILVENFEMPLYFATPVGFLRSQNQSFTH